MKKKIIGKRVTKPVYKSSKVCVTKILMILNTTKNSLCISYAAIAPFPNTN